MANRQLQFNRRKLTGFTGNQLKVIAFFLMICDHVGFMLIENGMLYGQNPVYWNMAINSETGRKLYLIARILRAAGRLAFPIFAFFISEGFIHSQNRNKYIARVGIFALISEVPFDLACFGKVYYPDYQNVLFTFFISLIALKVLSKLKKKYVLQILAAVLFAGAGYFCRCDYGAYGVGLVCMLWMLRNSPHLRLIAGAAASAAESVSFLGISALSFILLRFYNGQRGHARLGLFFYIMYPLHMIAFYLLVYLSNR